MDKPNENSNPRHASYFQRWYDMDVQLGELIRILESLSEESQTLFAFLLSYFCDDIIHAKGTRFFREMEWEKLIGIYKSKSGRRWYDQQQVLHVAFNKLYSVNSNAQSLIAKALYVPGRVVKSYEEACQLQHLPLDLDVVQDILATSFLEGPEALSEKYAAYY